jgi:hypothetical protein
MFVIDTEFVIEIIFVRATKIGMENNVQFQFAMDSNDSSMYVQITR